MKYILSLLALVFSLAAAAQPQPKVAALDYGRDYSATKQEALAKFDFVIVGNRSNMGAFVNGISVRNRDAKIAIYTIPTEVSCAKPDSTSYHYELWNAVQRYDWWLHRADGTRSQWTTSYSACDINLTSYAKHDASGRSWAEYKVQYDFDRIFKIAPLAEYVFSDNAFDKPRVDADWKRIGTNQLKTDPAIIDAVRLGQVAFWNALAAKGKKVIGNTDGDLSNSRYVEKLAGAFYEGAMGKSYSTESWSTWEAMFKRYQDLMRNTTDSLAFLQVYGAATDYKLMRYGLASAMMDNGWYLYMPSSGTLVSAWYDEYGAPIGAPMYAPPTAPYPGGDGYWRRTYTNGIVLVNPSKTKTSYAKIPAGYKHLSGAQDPTVNSGKATTLVTLPPRSGMLLLKQ